MTSDEMTERLVEVAQRSKSNMHRLDAVATFAVLALCALAILRDYAGALPYLTTLIGALQAVTGVVLGAYFNKSKAENTKGGIVYDTALGNTAPHPDADL